MTAAAAATIVEAMLANIQVARETLAGLTYHADYTIDDYPIGGRHRGKCRLTVEVNKKGLSRTVRQTTDKYGDWCKPKFSTYQDAAIYVVTGAPKHDAAWLVISTRGVRFCYANGSSDVLIEAPNHGYPPRRADETYTVEYQDIYGASHGSETNVIKADPPEVCDAWDLWVPAYRELLAIAQSKAAI